MLLSIEALFLVSDAFCSTISYPSYAATILAELVFPIPGGPLRSTALAFGLGMSAQLPLN